jgi:excisionase family DNA binding protein
MAQEIIFTSFSKEELTTIIQEVVRREILSLNTKEVSAPAEFLTENEASKFLKVSKVSLKCWRDSGRLKFYRIASRIRYKRTDLLEALQQNHFKNKAK